MPPLFRTPDDGRLRAGWRIALFFFVLGLVANGLIFLGVFLLGGRPEPGLGREFLMIGSIAVAMTALLPLGRRFLDRRDVRSLGLRFDRVAVMDLVFGWLLSGALAALFFGILLAFGLLELRGGAWDASAFVGPLVLSFALYLLVGWWEELFFRGYLFDNLVSGLGVPIAIGVSCVLYGVLHAFNPNATLLSTLIIVGFGFLRLYGLLSTRELWLSMGMHMGWNFFQGPVFGFAASGQGSFKLLSHETTGPSWLTGGAFGPEGSVLMLPIIGLGLLAMRAWARTTRPDVTPVAILPHEAQERTLETA